MPHIPPSVTHPTVAIPLCNLARHYAAARDDIDAAIHACLAHQQWIHGSEVAQFEDAVAQFLGVPYAVGVSSGTDALVLALRALAMTRTGQEYFTRDDEVVTTAFTFTATGDAILRAGATPVFVDIDPTTYAVDPRAVAVYCARPRGRVVGILPVHLYGHPVNLDALSAIAEERGCFLLEDAAQAFGAAWGGRHIGTFGDAAAFSFFPSKPLGGFGDGGMVTTRNVAFAECLRDLRQHGGRDKYNVRHLGYNARLDTIQAAILRVKLTRVAGWQAQRQQIAAAYDRAFHAVPSVTPPTVAPHATHAYHQYTLRIRNGQRDAFRSGLAASGVQSMVYYATPLHQMELFRGRAWIPAPLTETERAASEVVSIPIDALQTPEETAAVIAAVRANA